MGMVHTAIGLIDRDKLTVTDIVSEDNNYRCIATEWHLGDQLVKRDVHAIMLQGQALVGDQAAIA